jgi:hypothetical protein
MKTNNARLVILALGLLCAVALPGAKSGESTTRATQPAVISMVELLANKSRFNNQEIVVFGFLRGGYEELALYLSKDHAQHRSFADGIWLSFSNEIVILPRDRRAKNRYVTVRGIFSTGDPAGYGHLGVFPGEITVKTLVIH